MVNPERIDGGDEVDGFAVSFTNPKTGKTIRIYPDGQAEGLPAGFTVIVNRIPELVGRAAQLGFEEAGARIQSAHQELLVQMIGELGGRKS